MRSTDTNKSIKIPSSPQGKVIGKATIWWIFIMGLIAAPSLLHSQAKIGFFPVLSGSMSPTANTGDLFLTKVVEASTLRVGDIITVNNQITGTFYTHRIAEIRTADSVLSIMTKGDANPTIDQYPYVTSSIGGVSKEFFMVPLVGRSMIYLTSFQARQTAIIFLVASNVLGIFYLLFRKKIKANFGSEKVYKELYSDERVTSEHYRNLIDQLTITEMERNLMEDEKNLMYKDGK